MNWEQLQAILWLRWRLTKNQFRRGGRFNATVSLLLLGIMLLAAAGFALGGLALGGVLGTKASPELLLLFWDGVIFLFLIFWFSGVVVEIQRSESVDLTRLFHLPVTLQQVFVFNYALSHFTPSLVILAPGLMGLCAGLAFTGGPALAWTIPLVASFLFLLTAWTYCLRGWLAALIVNQRRWRTLIIFLTFAFVAVAQIPVLFVHSRLSRQQQQIEVEPYLQPTPSPDPIRSPGLPELFLRAHVAFPAGWPGYGTMELKEGRVATALVLTMAGFALGALGVIRAYHSAIRFYRGTEHASRWKIWLPQESRGRGPSLLERRLPLLRDDTAALMLATLRSLTRAPEMKMALVMPVMLCTMLALLQFSGLKPALNEIVISFAATAVVASAAFSLAPVMANVFGLDRNGFRGLMLLPTNRRDILLGKNLAFLPFLALLTVLILALVKWLLHLSWEPFLVALAQVPTAFLLLSPICNWTSIRVPHRAADRTLKAKKTNAIALLAGIGVMVTTPVVLLPLLIPEGLQRLFTTRGWLPWLPVNVLGAVAVFGGALWLYARLLAAQGRLLERHERDILREVTEEME